MDKEIDKYSVLEDRSFYDLKEDLREIDFLLRNPDITEAEINELLDRREGVKSMLTLKNIDKELF